MTKIPRKNCSEECPKMQSIATAPPFFTEKYSLYEILLYANKNTVYKLCNMNLLPAKDI
jgi:hypothetical protein